MAPLERPDGLLRVLAVLAWFFVTKVLLAAVLFVGVPLVALYALVRFVKWAWMN